LGVSVPSSGPLLILVRLFLDVESEPFRVVLCAGGEEIARFDAYRTDSVLLTPIVRGPQQARRLELSIRTQALDASTDGRERAFNVSYAGAFALWGLLGGHAIKHLAAAVGTFAIASAPRVRQAQPGRRGCDL